jgi:DNA invertase Pin-like site-specific DNA recombinase
MTNDRPRRPRDNKNNPPDVGGVPSPSRSKSPVSKAYPLGEGKAVRAVLYYRVSTNKQDEKNQVPDLRRYAEFRKWTITNEYIDHGISGAKDSRNDLDKMMAEIRAGQYDVLLIYSYDRFARSLPHLVLTMDELGRLGVHFASYQEQIDTTTPQGRLMFAIYAGLAEWQRHVTAEKTKAALRRKRDEEGMKLGRPEVPPDVRARVLELRSQGLSLSKIAEQVVWLRASGKYGARKEVSLSKSMVGKIVLESRTERPQNLRSNVA